MRGPFGREEGTDETRSPGHPVPSEVSMTSRLPPDPRPNLRTRESVWKESPNPFDPQWEEFRFEVELGDGGIRMTTYVRDVPGEYQLIMREEEWADLRWN